jgi:uncharacterized protein with GYD domain
MPDNPNKMGEETMPKFLIKATYTPEGMKGLRKDKASGREKAVAAACAAVGGKLDATYYALGDDDAFFVCDLGMRMTRTVRGKRRRSGTSIESFGQLQRHPCHAFASTR